MLYWPNLNKQTNKHHVTPFYMTLRMRILWNDNAEQCQWQQPFSYQAKIHHCSLTPASTASATPLHTLAPASSPPALTFVSALRFISSIIWLCLESQKAFSQIKWAELLIALGCVEATYLRDADSLRKAFRSPSGPTTDHEKEFNQRVAWWASFSLPLLIKHLCFLQHQDPLSAKASSSPKIKLILLCQFNAM